MKRRDKSEIFERKKVRVPSGATAAVPSEGAVAASPPPLVPYDHLLDQLHRAVDDQYTRSPHLAVFEEFHLDDPERTDLLSLKAAELFDQIRQRDPRDPLALHHLAVIHHGTGYRLHLDKKEMAGEAIVHWKKGVQAWAELVRNDGFWDALRARWQRHRDKNPHDMLVQRLLQVDLAAFRRHIPLHILNLHAAIVCESFHGDLKVAQAHMGLLLGSEFDARAVESVRKRLFEDLVGNVDDMCKALQFAEARQKVERYIQIDSGYLPALRAAVQVCCAECKHLAAGRQNCDERLRRLASCQATASNPDLIARAQHDRDILTAETLMEFHFQWALAEIHRAEACGENQVAPRNACFERALPKAQQAVAFEYCGQQARQLLQELCFGAAMANAGAENGDLRVARRFLDAGRKAAPQEPRLAALGALCHFRDDDMDRFRQELKNAERYNEAANDSTAANLIAQLRQLAERGGAQRELQRLFEKAGAAMRSHDFGGALACWTELERFVPELPDELVVVVYAQKAQCQFFTADWPGAKQSLRTARRRAGPGLSSEVRGLLDSLDDVLK